MKYAIALLALAAALFVLMPRGDREVDAQTSPTTYRRGGRTPDQIFQDAKDRADAAGRLMFLVYWQNDMSGAAIRAKKVLLEEQGPMLSKHFITADMFLNEYNKQFPILEKHLDGESPPYWFALKPDGTFVVGGGFDSVGSKGDGPWLETVKQLIEDYPPIPKRECPSIAKLYKSAERDYEAGNFEQVDKAMAKLKMVWWPTELAEPCADLWQRFSDDMNERIAPADQLVLDGDYEGAAAAYDAIMADLSIKGAIGPDIRHKLDLLKAKDYETLAAELAEDEADEPEDDEEDFDGNVFGDDEEDEDDSDGDDDGVSNPWDDEDDSDDDPDAAGDDDDDDDEEEVVDDSDEEVWDDSDDVEDDTEGDDEALDDEEDFDDDAADDLPPPIQPEPPSAEDKAKGLVQLAKMYRDKDMTDKAIAKLETCLRLFPDTKAAKEAKALLKAWQ